MIDLLALSLLPIWRWRVVAEQLPAGRSPADILETECDARAARYPARAEPSSALRLRAADAVQRGQRMGLHAIAWSEATYPVALAAIVDPPPVLWVRGCTTAFDAPAVAVVGSRAGSPSALAVAERLSADLAARGIVVVSGLARGVDSAAHRGALSAKGVTVAVLGCGADVVYPREHRALSGEIAVSGALISELVPGTPPKRQFFPRRNRIISGLCRAVVLVEAGEKSGSLITARCALEQGSDVLAVPGNVLNGRNRGGHSLLRDGARIVETADDIIDELGWERLCRVAGAGKKASGRSPAQPPLDPVLESLADGEPCDFDGIVARSGYALARLLTRLFELELQGLVRRVGGDDSSGLTDRARF